MFFEWCRSDVYWPSYINLHKHTHLITPYIISIYLHKQHTWSHHTLFPFTCWFLFHFRCYLSVSVECSAHVQGTSPYMPSVLIHALHTPYMPSICHPYPLSGLSIPLCFLHHTHPCPLTGVWLVSSPYHIKSDYWHILPNLHKILFSRHYLLKKSQKNQNRSISELLTSQNFFFFGTFWGCFLVLKFARFQIYWGDLMFTIHEKCTTHSSVEDVTRLVNLFKAKKLAFSGTITP